MQAAAAPCHKGDAWQGAVPRHQLSHSVTVTAAGDEGAPGAEGVPPGAQAVPAAAATSGGWHRAAGPCWQQPAAPEADLLGGLAALVAGLFRAWVPDDLLSQHQLQAFSYFHFLSMYFHMRLPILPDEL